jgi:hypothetical protein
LEETCGSACRWPHRSTGGSVMPITLAGALLIIASSRSPRRGEGPQGAVIELAHRGTSARPPSLDGCSGGSLHREVIIRHQGNLSHLIMQIPCPLKYKSGCIPVLNTFSYHDTALSVYRSEFFYSVFSTKCKFTYFQVCSLKLYQCDAFQWCDNGNT